MFNFLCNLLILPKFRDQPKIYPHRHTEHCISIRVKTHTCRHLDRLVVWNVEHLQAVEGVASGENDVRYHSVYSSLVVQAIETIYALINPFETDVQKFAIILVLPDLPNANTK
jgi:hypothetical protein